MGDLHVMRFGMWERCTKAGPKPLDIWELCTVDEAEQRLTDQDNPKKVVKMTLIAQKVITRTQKEVKSYPHSLCINGVLVYGNTARSHVGTLHGAKNDQN